MRNNRPLLFTAINSVCVFVFGIVRSQRGPAFNDLIQIAHTDVQGGSMFITASGLGAMLGCVVAGAVYGRIKRKPILIIAPLTVSGVFIALTPWCSVYEAMVVVHALTSFATGIYDTAINTEEIQAWDGNSQSAFQFVSFCYSLGGVLGPFITEPFLAAKEARIHNRSISSDNSSSILVTSLLNGNLSTSSDSSMIPTTPLHPLCPNLDPNCMDSSGYSLPYNVSSSNISLNNYVIPPSAKSHVQYAYLISGAASIVVGIISCCAMHIWSYPIKERKTIGKGEIVQTFRKIPFKTMLWLLILVCVFFFFYSMAINSFVEYLFYFAVTHLDWSKETGAYIVSLYWGLGMVMKLALTFIYRWVTARVVLICSVGTVVASFAAFCITAYYHLDTLVWISCAGLALGQASIFAGGFAWTDGNLFLMKGKATGALMVSTYLGPMIAPLPVGILMKNWTLMAFPYFVLLQSCISGFLFLVIMFVVKPFLNRRYGPLRPPILNTISEEDEGQEMIAKKEVFNDILGSQILMAETA